MYRIAAITFHHAYNYGSALQAYALQEYMKALGWKHGIQVDYQIIDFYTQKQENLYSVYKPGSNPRSIVKNLIAFPYAKQLRKKNGKFEAFLQTRCQLTSRFVTEDELRQAPPEADCYISGSDQLWNVRATDFSTAYFFDFLPEQCKRISYAASLGPLPIDWSRYAADHCRDALEKYSHISVREQGSVENIAAITDAKCEINVDPTLLLNIDSWRRIQSDANYRNGKYILLYCLEPTKEQLKMAKAISQKCGLPIVILRYNNKNDMLNRFVKKYDAGPEDFLAYIDHAALVLSSSFHGTAFAMLYHKPFYCFHGMKDNRISNILRRTEMVDRSLESMGDIDRVSIESPDGVAIDQVLNEERKRSADYLMSAFMAKQEK